MENTTLWIRMRCFSKSLASMLLEMRFSRPSRFYWSRFIIWRLPCPKNLWGMWWGICLHGVVESVEWMRIAIF